MKSTSFKLAILALLVLTIGIFDLGNTPTTLADDPPPFVSLPGQATPPTRAQQSPKKSSKISSVIRGALQELQAAGITQGDDQSDDFLSFSRDRVIRVSATGDIQTYIIVESSAEDEIESLEKLGARIEIVNRDVNIVQAWIPFDKVESIAELGIVRKIRTPDYGFTRKGSVTTEGDAILNSDDVRELLGITGAGMKIGVISDGVDSRSAAQATGDLPVSIEIDPSLPGHGDEGTAMLEIIHDIAPNASLAFSGFQTSGAFTTLDMVDSVNFLANTAFGGTGTDIIVDDLGFFRQPYFEDGFIAQAVQNVVDNGTIYVSSAGNGAQKHYEGDYVAGNLNDHEFSAGDTGMGVLVSGFGSIRVFLQWNDEFGLSGQDYDLYACSVGSTPNAILLEGFCFFSDDPQEGFDDPLEFLELINNGPTVDLDIFIDGDFADEVRRLELFIFGNIILNEHGVSAGSVYGHAGVPGAIAVGAINANPPGNDTIASCSSLGPSDICFPSFQRREKPDIAATDGVSVTGAGGFPSTFFGTSAAAPHVAGIAALLLQAVRVEQPGISKINAATEVFDTLQETAIDLGSEGFDTSYGAGWVDALAAVQTTEVSLLDIKVNSTGDGGDFNLADPACDDGSGNCKLRAAIEQANFNFGTDIIEFNIDGPGPHTIQPSSALPTITDPVIIDGYTQPGAAPNTNAPGLGTNAVIKIELDGSDVVAEGLLLLSDNNTIRGLSVHSFEEAIVVLSDGNTIEGNFIGIDATGAIQSGGTSGISIEGVQLNKVGGPPWHSGTSYPATTSAL